MIGDPFQPLNTPDQDALPNGKAGQSLDQFRGRRWVLRAQDLSDAELEAITSGEMDPRHKHLNAELE